MLPEKGKSCFLSIQLFGPVSGWHVLFVHRYRLPASSEPFSIGGSNAIGPRLPVQFVFVLTNNKILCATYLGVKTFFLQGISKAVRLILLLVKSKKEKGMRKFIFAAGLAAVMCFGAANLQAQDVKKCDAKKEQCDKKADKCCKKEVKKKDCAKKECTKTKAECTKATGNCCKNPSDCAKKECTKKDCKKECPKNAGAKKSCCKK
ncbi:hypothetical protein JCM10003_1054 [Bacteroides pyogenes JCM 10003]|nr:hypothetical protein JCM10003_1054 [Bacteroides pyogenes JCM 10003]